MRINFENIYRHVGYLFYGTARKIDPTTNTGTKKLEDAIVAQWAPTDTVEHRLVAQMFLGIRTAHAEDMAADEAIDLFLAYYEMEKLAFSPALRSKILRVIEVLWPGNGIAERARLAKALQVSDYVAQQH